MPAKTREDVEAQSTKDRLWESLDYSYGQQRQASDKSYDQAYSQADRQLLSRGMQRSSYGAQTLANINQQKIDNQNNIWQAQIADYQNRLTDLENQEWQKDFQERQFAEGQRQFDTSLAFQQERAAAADNQWQQQFDYGKQRDAVSDQQWNMTFNYGKERDAVSDNQWERQFAEGQRQANQSTANSYLMSILSSGQMPSDEMLAAAGISRADAELIRSYYAQQIAAANAAKAGSSGGRGGSNNRNGSGDSGNTGDTGAAGNTAASLASFLQNMGIDWSETPGGKAASSNKTATSTPGLTSAARITTNNTLTTARSNSPVNRTSTSLDFLSRKPDTKMSKR